MVEQKTFLIIEKILREVWYDYANSPDCQSNMIVDFTPFSTFTFENSDITFEAKAELIGIYQDVETWQYRCKVRENFTGYNCKTLQESYDLAVIENQKFVNR